MHDLAIEYLKYLHGLEIAAGINFRAVHGDLQCRGRLSRELGRDLIRCQQQEMRHAWIVREMLVCLGAGDARGLKSIPMWIISGLADGLPQRWPVGMDAYAGICFNRELEGRFARGGVQAFADMMDCFADTMKNAVPRAQMAFLIASFERVVQADERWHVEIDEQVFELYQDIHFGYDMPGLLATLQVTRSPFIHIIRAKRAFLRSLVSARAPVHGPQFCGAELSV